MEPLEPTSSSNEELPRRNLKAVGPTRPSADQGGRSAIQWAHQLSSLSCWLFTGPTGHWLVSWLLSYWSSSPVGRPIHVMYMWRRLIGRHLAP